MNEMGTCSKYRKYDMIKWGKRIETRSDYLDLSNMKQSF